MENQNKLSNMIGKLNRLPSILKKKALTMVVGKVVPYVNTSGLVVEEMSRERVMVSMQNLKRIQNHIKGVHATAMVLMAETATGFVSAMNCPDEKILLMKSLSAQYKKRSKGNMKAVATLTSEQAALMASSDKGEVNVEVHVTDETGSEPVLCQMIWAWLPKK